MNSLNIFGHAFMATVMLFTAVNSIQFARYAWTPVFVLFFFIYSLITYSDLQLAKRG